MQFNIEPGIGALPIRFGMSRQEVYEFLGEPNVSHEIWDHSGTTDFWNQNNVNVSYNSQGIVNHIGFCPGGFELRLSSELIWSADESADPNPTLLKFDPDPKERLGFLVYNRIGVTTTGYHDEDDSQRSLTVYPRGDWDEQLKEATTPNLSRYARES